MKKISQATEYLSAYLLADNLVVLNQHDGQLHALDEIGDWLLLVLDESIAQADITAKLQQQGIEKQQIVENLVAIQALFSSARN